MLTGTPLDLTPFGSVLYGLGPVLTLTLISVAVWVFYAVRRPWFRAVFLAAIVAIFVLPRLQSDIVRHESQVAFERLCYERASEEIIRTSRAVKDLIMLPERGPKGAYEFDLFYGASRPKRWGSSFVSMESSAKEAGAYEVRHTYLPEMRSIWGTDIVFHGVRIDIYDRTSGQLMGTRTNFQWGMDFNRGQVCLGSDWFDDNQSFIERVIGPRYLELAEAEYLRRMNRRFERARLEAVDEVDVAIPYLTTEALLPAGSKFDYNNRTIWLPNGSFRMMTFSGAEPIPIVATVVLDSQYVFAMLPQGFMQNRPPRQMMFNYRTSAGEHLRDVIALIPPGIDWSPGWGIDPKDIRVEQSRIVFKLLGDKVSGASAGRNDGTYRKKYTLVLDLR